MAAHRKGTRVRKGKTLKQKMEEKRHKPDQSCPYQLYHVVSKDFKLVPPSRSPMSVEGDWIWIRLSFEKVVHARKITPARITPDLDQSSTNLNQRTCFTPLLNDVKTQPFTMIRMISQR